MARPIWRGNISFGLVNIPVNLFTAEKPSEQVSFHLLDKKTHTRIHNQRVNEHGKEVAWDDIERGYEFEKGKYLIVDPKLLEETAASNYATVAIEEFVPLNQIDPIYFEKPYYLMPADSGVKGYILLHDIMQRANKVAVAKVVIKTREHIAIIMAQQEYLTMILIRYVKELRSLAEVANDSPLKKEKIKITAREMKLAEELVANMSGNWDPKKYHDDNRELLLKLIKSEIKRGKGIIDKSAKHKSGSKKATGENILDFMDLLQKSVAKKEKGTTTRKPTKTKRHK